jgi:hypothetical protein
MSGQPTEDASAEIDSMIAARGHDWRGERLARLRELIKEADPEVVETVKWRKPSNPTGIPVWEHDGLICGGEVFKGKVKLTFERGAALPDPSACSTRGSEAIPAGPSTCTRARRSTRRRSRP